MTSDSGLLIRPMTASDWPEVEAIWAAGIATGHATFEPAPPSWDEFNAGRRADLRLVAKQHGRLVGWAAASPVSTRPVYRGVVEHSIYLSPEARGQGYAGQLLDTFIRHAEEAGVWTIQSTIFPENTASIALHQRHGFTIVGTRRRIGLMGYGPAAGQWRDTVLLEYRSPPGLE
ncbi:GNAT family N-acetyltransferase [Paenarthrobacter sp. NPDC089675]|uniref:GNAT family N-acetyltransferase n=1 Tax=Paenarthrobacter sp. NPDC089675 TaxID=3364376 RepID=UPI0037FA9079